MIRFIGKLCVLRHHYRWTERFRGDGTATPYHFLYLLSEGFVYQSVHKWVDSSIEQDKRVDDGVRVFTYAERCVVIHGVCNYVGHPTDPKHDRDSYRHQGDSLPHSEYALRVARYKSN